MSTTSSRTVQIQFSGDVTLGLIQSALDNIVTPAEVTYVNLTSGNNSIVVPQVTGVIATSLTIIPPAGNTVLITLKGANGDTGVPLHKTDPTSIALDSTFLLLVLSVPSNINAVRLIWA